MTMLDRRAVLAGSLALAASGCAPTAPPPAPPPPIDLETLPSLRALASARGLFYGCATSARLLDRDPAFAAAVARECAMLAPENAGKWEAVEPAPGLFDFSGLNALADFARARDMALRGHCLVWHRQVPAWVPPALKADNPRNLLEAHVRRVVEQYRGAMHSWDVVNEAVELNDGRPDGLRQSIWLDALGPGYLDLAFRTAREADPSSKLVYNDYGLEHAEVWNVRKRVAVLDLLRGLRQRAVPIDALGLQSHLRVGKPFDAAGLAAFVRAVAALGLDVYVTELDVSDAALPDTAAREGDAARLVGAYLAAVLAEPAVKGVLTWGLSDKYSWLNTASAGELARADGRETRGLPLDGAMKRTQVWRAMAEAFAGRGIGA